MIGAVTHLRTVEAARLLDVTPNMLRAWESHFAFPTASIAPGGQRAFAFTEIIALRDALRSEQSVSAAVRRARADLWGESVHGTDGSCRDAV